MGERNNRKQRSEPQGGTAIINGLSHITLIVEDIHRTAHFLCSVLDAEEVYSSDGNSYSLSEEKFFLIGNVWLCVMQGKPLPQPSYNHIAFHVDETDLDAYHSRILSAGLEILPPRPRVPGEGRSIYFYDYDNHLFELHTGSLAERLARYRQCNGGIQA